MTVVFFDLISGQGGVRMGQTRTFLVRENEKAEAVPKMLQILNKLENINNNPICFYIIKYSANGTKRLKILKKRDKYA